MSFLSDAWHSITHEVSKTWKDLTHGNIGGLIGDVINVALDTATFGGYSLAKAAIKAFIPKPGTPESTYQDRVITSVSATSPREIIYGRAKVGGQVVYRASSGKDDEFFHLIIVFATHQIEAFESVYFGDEEVITWDGSGMHIISKYSPKLLVYSANGAQTTANAAVVAATPSEWDSTCALAGQAYLYFRFQYDTTLYQSGVPRISAVIKGKNDILDPRSSFNNPGTLIDPSTWVIGSTGSQPGFPQNGPATFNSVISDIGPFGTSEPVWLATNASDNGADGGWNGSPVSIDATKSYRSVVWIKRKNDSGVAYLGCQRSGTLNLDGSANTNPYFWDGNLPQHDKWYLVVGIIHGSAYTGAASGISGVYDPVTGQKVIAGTDFKNAAGITTQMQRAYLYYSMDATQEQRFARPRFEEITGLEPSVQMLLSIREYGWTDNQALCVLDYLLSDAGFSMSQSDINLQTFKDGANLCDQLVASGVGTTEPRYTVNGSITLDGKPLDILASLNVAGSSTCVYSQGTWSYVGGQYETPMLSLSESDLVGGLQFQVGAGKQGRLNSATGTYIDAAQKYSSVDFVPIQVSNYITRDGEALKVDLQLPFTDSGTMARRLGKIQIERSRYGLVVSATFKYKALAAGIGDRVSLTIPELGWSSKVFRVTGVQFAIGSGVTLDLHEDAAAIYDWTEGEALAVAAPPAVNLPNPYSVAAPTQLAVTEELYATNVKSQIKTRAYFSWTQPSQAALYYDVEINRESAGWQRLYSSFGATQVVIDDLQPGSFQFRVRGINAIGARSGWVTLTQTILGKAAPPPDVTTLFLDRGFLRWTLVNPPLDLAGYKIRYQDGNRQLWVDAIPLHDGLVTSTRFDITMFAGGTRTFLVKAVDTTGNESVNAAILVQNLGDPTIQNVILHHSLHDASFPGTITNGSVNASGNIEADQVGGFYGAGTDVFYPTDGATLFYESSFKGLTYEFTYTPTANEVPSQLTLTSTINSVNATIEYIPPDAPSAGYVEWPGVIEQVAQQQYSWRITIPAQTSTAAPTIDEIVLNLDVPDVFEVLNNVTIAAGGSRLPITKNYHAIKYVSVTLQQDGSGVFKVEVADKNATSGPLVQAFNAAGTAVQSIIDASVRGY